MTAEILDISTRRPYTHNRFKRLDVNQLNDGERQWIISTVLGILKKRHSKGVPLTKPEDTRNYLQLLLAENTLEVFGMLFLDNQHRAIAFEEIFQGTIDGTGVYPRVVVERALLLHATAVIAVHNHPSGRCTPSNADKQITGKIKEALALLDIRLLDHIIVSAEETYSFAEAGLL